MADVILTIAVTAKSETSTLCWHFHDVALAQQWLQLFVWKRMDRDERPEHPSELSLADAYEWLDEHSRQYDYQWLHPVLITPPLNGWH